MCTIFVASPGDLIKFEDECTSFSCDVNGCSIVFTSTSANYHFRHNFILALIRPALKNYLLVPRRCFASHYPKEEP